MNTQAMILDRVLDTLSQPITQEAAKYLLVIRLDAADEALSPALSCKQTIRKAQ
jgi:hypothetical protein